MNFFEQQLKTKRRTRKLCVLFALSVLSIALINYGLVTAWRYAMASGGTSPFASPIQFSFWDTSRFLWTLIPTMSVILIVSFFKKNSLKEGGKSVALMMGGRPIDPMTQHFLQKRALMVVEEMALASGIPVPDVYLLGEKGINAFAAGYTVDDAVIGITQGALEHLNREELQGIVAHEFSHIFHGDMKINLYLMSLLHGILFFYTSGQSLIQYNTHYDSLTPQRRIEPYALVLGGILMAVGYVGFFLARVIQSAISRQREYLADASAVQYTRNPHGILQALSKIGGFVNPRTSRSLMHHPNTSQIDHMTFSLANIPFFWGAFATHPPITERIQAIDTSFHFQNIYETFWSHQHISSDLDLDQNQAQSKPEPSSGTLYFAGPDEKTFSPSFENALGLNQEHLFLQDLDPVIYQACHHPQKAKIIIHALLQRPDNPEQSHALKQHLRQTDPYITHVLDEILPKMTSTLFQHRIELFDLCMPSLRRLSWDACNNFLKSLHQLIAADQRMTFSEWVFVELVQKHLMTFHKRGLRQPLIAFETEIQGDIEVLFSVLVHANKGDQTEKQQLFSMLAQPCLGASRSMSLIPEKDLTLPMITQAYKNIDRGHDRIKSTLFQSLKPLFDQKVSYQTFEIYRAFSDGLGNPLPVQTSKSH